MAAKKLGLKEVPILLVEHLTEAQKRAYIIADNRLALDAGWDEEMLRVEFAELADDGFNFVVGLAGGYEVFGTPEQYDKFMDKYLTWLETRKMQK